MMREPVFKAVVQRQVKNFLNRLLDGRIGSSSKADDKSK
jgi:hypothetical protein